MAGVEGIIVADCDVGFGPVAGDGGGEVSDEC